MGLEYVTLDYDCFNTLIEHLKVKGKVPPGMLKILDPIFDNLIKNCPCCGAKADIRRFGSGYMFIECTECSIRTSDNWLIGHDEMKLIMEWNKRV